MKLSILIPSTFDRLEMTDSLIGKLKGQIKTIWPAKWYSDKTESLSGLTLFSLYNDELEILVLFDSYENSIGFKRNKLLELSEGHYLSFVDSDDDTSPNYIDLLITGMKTEPDCLSLLGEYSVDGKLDGIFEHSIKYREWRNDLPGKVKYERNPNHLNCIKSSIAKQFKFPETNFGEDHDWSKQLQASGLLKTEVHIPEILYYYKYKSKK